MKLVYLFVLPITTQYTLNKSATNICVSGQFSDVIAADICNLTSKIKHSNGVMYENNSNKDKLLSEISDVYKHKCSFKYQSSSFTPSFTVKK